MLIYVVPSILYCCASGSSAPPPRKNTKASASRKRFRHLEEDEQGVFVDPAVIAQRQKDEARQKRNRERDATREARGRGKRVLSVKEMPLGDYQAMRAQDYYEEFERDMDIDNCFWHVEQESV